MKREFRVTLASFVAIIVCSILLSTGVLFIKDINKHRLPYNFKFVYLPFGPFMSPKSLMGNRRFEVSSWENVSIRRSEWEFDRRPSEKNHFAKLSSHELDEWSSSLIQNQFLYWFLSLSFHLVHVFLHFERRFLWIHFVLRDRNWAIFANFRFLLDGKSR